MGAPVNFTNRIWIGEKSWKYKVLQQTGYLEIDDEFLKEIAKEPKIKTVQIDQALPEEAYQRIDRILEVRPDICFRIYGLHGEKKVDISFLRTMKHLRILSIDCIHMKDNPELIDLSVLTDLDLKSLTLDCFDLRDYSFIQHLSEGLEELSVFADTMGPGISFDYEWLLRYEKLQALWLGKKAKKHIECLKELPMLSSLSLRGIKITDFSFLKEMNVEKLALLWNSNNDLHELRELTTLKEIELWRINKLEDISFIEYLTDLEAIKLQDLKHVKSLPDLSRHTKLKTIYLIDTGIKIEDLPVDIQSKVQNWDNRS